MNYFDHHIGDYDEDTAHLTACEDGIYHRLIRKYYAKEKPLPADVAKLQRWVRAKTEEEQKAVVDVLEEFFTLQADGYHQKTCDEVIAAYQAGEPERVVKKANENNRTTRHRLERSRLFQVLVAAGQHAPWNIGITELRAMVALIPGQNTAPVTATARKTATNSNVTATAPVTPVTATHTPPTTTQSSTEANASVTTQVEKKTRADRGERLSKDWLLPQGWGNWALGKYPHWTPDIVRAIAAKFRNHWVSKTGKDATKLDWEATWQNWCTSAITQREFPPTGSAVVPTETNFARTRRERVSSLTGGLASVKAPGVHNPTMEVFDAEAPPLIGQ